MPFTITRMLAPVFQPFQPRGEVTVYRRNMPHWRQKGCTYFITFRLADSIPRTVLLQWREERRLWLQSHQVTFPLDTEEGLKQYLRINVADRRRFERGQVRQLHLKLDRGHGSCLLAEPANRKPVETSFHHFHGSRVWCGDFVIMPNHVHGLMTPIGDWQIEQILQSIKRFTATTLSKRGQSKERLWQKESFDRIVRDRAELRAYRDYIRNNPVKSHVPARSFSAHEAPWITEALMSDR